MQVMEEQRCTDMWQSGDESQTCQFVFGLWNAYGLPLFWTTITHHGTAFNFSHSPASLMTGNFTSLAAHVGHSRVLVPERFVFGQKHAPRSFERATASIGSGIQNACSRTALSNRIPVRVRTQLQNHTMSKTTQHAYITVYTILVIYILQNELFN